jgi:D-glycero-alpha-D-manno-heptose-7-phosphate kinase
MLITKTPFRISFCGGGSDIASFYEKFGGCVVSASINKYMYILIHPYFNAGQTVLKYSRTEVVNDIADIEHRIFNCVLNEWRISGVEITCTADVPAGTGLGSSSAFTVGLLHTLACYSGKYMSKHRLAELACAVEIEKLGAPIGKQDQYAAALGGLNFIEFNRDGSVSHSPIIMRRETWRRLQDSLSMYYIGDARDANAILAEQNKNMVDGGAKAGNLREMCRLAREMKAALENNDLSSFGEILDESWRLKKTLASGISNAKIDALYARAADAGAIGGKLLGAGGGGFLMFFSEPARKERIRVALGLKALDFAFEQDGSGVVYIGDKYW